jgi:X-X-X-Leu-X-X-Gly heptad repeat protein
MRNLKYLFAAAAIGSLMVLPQASSANPLATSGLGSLGSGTPAIADGLVQRVHGWHCRKRWSKRRGWHRHRRACYDDYSYYDDDYYYPHHYGYHAYPFFPAPFIGFHFGGKRRHHWDWDD